MHTAASCIYCALCSCHSIMCMVAAPALMQLQWGHGTKPPILVQPPPADSLRWCCLCRLRSWPHKRRCLRHIAHTKRCWRKGCMPLYGSSPCGVLHPWPVPLDEGRLNNAHRHTSHTLIDQLVAAPAVWTHDTRSRWDSSSASTDMKLAFTCYLITCFMRHEHHMFHKTASTACFLDTSS